MKWHSESFGDYRERMFEWHRYFAWFPVFCYETRRTVWLEYVQRKAIDYSGYLEEFSFEYKEE